jgi:hypothetical protein
MNTTKTQIEALEARKDVERLMVRLGRDMSDLGMPREKLIAAVEDNPELLEAVTRMLVLDLVASAAKQQN